MKNEVLLVGHRRLAGSNKSSHYDHRLILCAVGTLLARGAGLALRPHRDRKCRSTDIIMCAVGYLLVHESSKCRSTEIISHAVGLLLVHESRKHRKDLESSASLRSDLVRKAAMERGRTI